MLIEKPIQTNDVVTIKLITGEEIIGRLVSDNSDTITVQKVLVVTLGMDPSTNRPAIQMMPYFTLGGNPESRITLRREHVIAMLPSSDDMRAGYVHNTSSLLTPTQGSSLLA